MALAGGRSEVFGVCRVRGKCPALFESHCEPYSPVQVGSSSFQCPHLLQICRSGHPGFLTGPLGLVSDHTNVLQARSPPATQCFFPPDYQRLICRN